MTHSERRNMVTMSYSIVETAKENGLNSFKYLMYLFEELPNINTTDGNALDKLLSWSESLPNQCRVMKDN